MFSLPLSPKHYEALIRAVECVTRIYDDMREAQPHVRRYERETKEYEALMQYLLTHAAEMGHSEWVQKNEAGALVLAEEPAEAVLDDLDAYDHHAALIHLAEHLAERDATLTTPENIQTEDGENPVHLAAFEKRTRYYQERLGTDGFDQLIMLPAGMPEEMVGQLIGASAQDYATQSLGTQPEQLDAKDVSMRLSVLFLRYDINTSMSVDVEQHVFEADTDGTPDFQPYQEWFLSLFPESALESPQNINEILALATDAWNAFPHRALDGKSPVEVIRDESTQESATTTAD